MIGAGPDLEPPAPTAAPDAAMAVVHEWQRRTQAEYTSAAIAHGVTLALIEVGAPPDLIRDGLRVTEDELTHSELSAAVVAAAADGSAPAPVSVGDLGGLRVAGSLPGLGRTIVRSFCIGETLAVPLFRMLRADCTVPVARRALDRVLRDEQAHRRFGWDVLDWLLVAGGEPVRLQLAPLVATAIAEVTDAYGSVGGPASLDARARAWGLAAPPSYAATVRRAIGRDVLPRFHARDLADGAAPG